MRNKMKKVLLIIATTVMNCTIDSPIGTLDDLIDAADEYNSNGTDEKFSELLFIRCNEVLGEDSLETFISEWEDAVKDSEGGEEALKEVYAQYGVEM